MNLLHDLPHGTHDEMTCVIEINKGSKNKYEIDKETGIIALDRVMHTAQDYPFDYGFVPQTLGQDGDALDIVLLTTYPLFPGILVRVRAVGILHMIDNGESDAKIIAVPCNDPRFDSVKDIADVNPHTLKEIEHFFQTYKKVQNKVVETNGFADRATALQEFDECVARYKNDSK